MITVEFDVFVAAWNDRQGMTTPKLHADICRWLAERRQAGDRRLLLTAFRNSGKSTLVGLFSAWLLALDPNLRIVVMAADLALAGKMVRNVRRIVERHPMTRHLKPERADQWASERFTVERPTELRDPSMLAKGIGANVTGSRADVIICDDVEVPNTCDTAPKRADLRERLSELDFVLVPGGLQLYVGTPHTYYSLYADAPRPETGEEAPFLDGFARLELPLLNVNGKSCWPERFPDAEIDALKRASGPAKFQSQMMLRPTNVAEGRLDPDKMRLYDDDLVYREGNGEASLHLGGRQLVSVSSWWDPSYGSPTGGDASVVAAVFTDEAGDYWLHRVAYLEHDPKIREDIDEATQLCRQVAGFARALYLPAVTLETNGLGRFLPGLLRRELAAAGLRCAVVETASRRSKDLRIVDAFDAVLAAGRLHAHRDVWATSFVTEMREWRPGGRGPDDGLDAVSGCLLAEPVRLPRRPQSGADEMRSRANWRPGHGGFKANTEFEV